VALLLLLLLLLLVGDLKTVARVVVDVSLSENLLEFIITMFDEDGKDHHWESLMMTWRESCLGPKRKT